MGSGPGSLDEGEPANQISNSFGGRPTRQQIQKRAKKEGWAQLLAVTGKHIELSLKQLGLDTPANRQTILGLLAQSVPSPEVVRICSCVAPASNG